MSFKLVQDERAERFRDSFASVAVILREESGGLHTLLMKRATVEGDPWSGDVAFPGGRVEEGDTSLKHTAERETAEEMGIDLREKARFLGYLGAFSTRGATRPVTPSIFLLGENVQIVKDDKEVFSYDWAPIRHFTKPEAAGTFRRERDGIEFENPAFVYKDYVIWGLTYRILENLVSQVRQGLD